MDTESLIVGISFVLAHVNGERLRTPYLRLGSLLLFSVPFFARRLYGFDRRRFLTDSRLFRLGRGQFQTRFVVDGNGHLDKCPSVFAPQFDADEGVTRFLAGDQVKVGVLYHVSVERDRFVWCAQLRRMTLLTACLPPLLRAVPRLDLAAGVVDGGAAKADGHGSNNGQNLT